jgi:DNA-binding transcriptional LysR family regulator
MIDRFYALKLFARVARTGNFSRAAKEAGLSQPSASRLIRQLEKQIGAALFTRSTRAVVLTGAGADFLVKVEAILLALEEAEYAARGTGELRGNLRVSVGGAFATRELIPNISEFILRHPALHVELLIDDARHDLVTEAVDVALRFGVLSDTSAVARRLAEVPTMIVASPAYLKRAGTPKKPSELMDHDVIKSPSGSRQNAWTFKKGGQTTSVRVRFCMTVTTNEASVAASVAGLGIINTGLWACRTELESRKLVRLLPDWKLDSVVLNAVFAGGRTASASARAFVEHLAGVLNRAKNTY